MQTNEIVGQVQKVKRLPDVDEAPVAKRPKLETRAEQPNASRPVTTKRNARRFGAGF